MCLDIFLLVCVLTHSYLSFPPHTILQSFCLSKLSIPVIPVELIDIEIDRFPIITETTCIFSHMYCIEVKDTPVGSVGDTVVTSSFGLMFPARGQGTCDL
jgi:hypothetical protein